MELRQLEHFVAVAEDQSFTRAAHRLGYVQSALSVSIQALERELGLRLLDRTTHRVSLTDAGHVLLPSARATLAGAETFRDEAAGLHGVVRGTLRIGIMQAFAAADVPGALGRFHREHPLVDVTIRPALGGSQSMLESVAEGELDVAFVAVAELPAGLDARPLASEPLLLAFGPGFEPVVKRGRARLSDLSDETFVDFPVGWNVRTVIDRAFRQLGIARRVGIEVADVGTHVRLVREGLGIALLPDSLMGADGASGLTTLPTEPGLSWSPAVVTRGGGALSPAATAFLELL